MKTNKSYTVDDVIKEIIDTWINDVRPGNNKILTLFKENEFSHGTLKYILINRGIITFETSLDVIKTLKFFKSLLLNFSNKNLDYDDVQRSCFRILEHYLELRNDLEEKIIAQRRK